MTSKVEATVLQRSTTLLDGVDDQVNVGNVNDKRIEAHRVFYYLEHACNAWFTLEITIRCLVSRSKNFSQKGLCNKSNPKKISYRIEIQKELITNQIQKSNS